MIIKSSDQTLDLANGSMRPEYRSETKARLFLNSPKSFLFAGESRCYDVPNLTGGYGSYVKNKLVFTAILDKNKYLVFIPRETELPKLVAKPVDCNKLVDCAI